MINMDWRLKMQGAALAGKKVLLTHSGDGMGFVIAIAFAQAGAAIVIHDRSAAVIAAAVEHLSLAVPGSRVSGEEADLSTEAGVRQLLDKSGSIDILVMDEHAVGVVTFSRLEERASLQDRQALRARALLLLNSFVGNMKGQGPSTLFMLSLAPTDADPSSTCVVSHSIGNDGRVDGLTVHTVSVRDLILAPVADLIKSEVLRTNGTVADVSEQLLHDHRPVAIDQGLTAIRKVTAEIIGLCSSLH
jgi:hypothetical protein